MKTSQKTSKVRLALGTVVAGALVAGLGAQPALGATAEDDPVADILAEAQFLVGDLVNASGAVPAGQGVLTYSAVLTLTPGTKAPTVSDVVTSIGPVDQNGSAAGPVRVLSDGVTIAAAPGGKAAAVDCLWRGPKKHRVRTFAPTRVAVQTPIGTLNVASALARAARTADVVGQPEEAQWVGCVSGGATLGEGLRVLQAGGGLAYRDAEETAKFGMAWRRGDAPERYELSSAFPVGYKTKGAMVGAVRQVAGGELLGSFVAQVPNPTEAFARNGVHAYWQDLCVDETPCPGGAGSRGFHGATGHVVWALPGEGARQFVLTGYVRYACGNPAAAACA